MHGSSVGDPVGRTTAAGEHAALEGQIPLPKQGQLLAIHQLRSSAEHKHELLEQAKKPEKLQIAENVGLVEQTMGFGVENENDLWIFSVWSDENVENRLDNLQNQMTIGKAREHAKGLYGEGLLTVIRLVDFTN